MKINILLLIIIICVCGKLKAQNDTEAVFNTCKSSHKKIIIKYGIASYYAEKFHGRRSADGSTFSSLKYTAACNVLPLGTWIKVTNLKNEKSVVLKITDRLHPKNKRLVDLSKVAAQKLGYVGAGITRVKLEVLGELPQKKYKKFT